MKDGQDISYWGGVPKVSGNVPGQIYDYQANRLRDLAESEKRIMRAQGPASPLGWLSRGLYGNQPAVDAISGAQPYLGSLRDTLEPVVEQAFNSLNPAGLAGMIVGKGAQKAFSDDMVLETKRLMLPKDQGGEGLSLVKAVEQTGHYPDRFGTWKTQISDANAELKPEFIAAISNWKPRSIGYNYQMGSLYKHPELYENYPNIARSTNIQFTTDVKYASTKSEFNKQTGKYIGSKIKINPLSLKREAKKLGVPMEELLKDWMVHEGSHVVQGIDMMPGGSTKQWFTDARAALPKLKKELAESKDVLNQIPASSPRAKELIPRVKELEEHIKFMDRVKLVKDSVLYETTQGEMDAFYGQMVRHLKYPESILPPHEVPNVNVKHIPAGGTG